MAEALTFGIIGAVIGVSVVLVFFALRTVIVFSVKAIKKQGVETSDSE